MNPKITYKNHSVKILTDEIWGSTWESNLKTMAYGLYACHERESVFENSELKLDKFIFNAKHYPLLEFSNIEVREDDLNLNIGQYRDWINLHQFKEPHSVLVGSLRDICQINNDKIFNINDLKESYNSLPKTKINKKHPEKRIMMLVETNQDNAHKFRTERAISQLSLTGTETFKQSDNEIVIVGSNPEELRDKFNDIFIESYKLSKKAQEQSYKHYISLGFEDKKAINFSIYDAKHFNHKYSKNIRVMAGTVKDFIAMCEKRLKSPEKKKDVLDLSQLILNEIEIWRNN